MSTYEPFASAFRDVSGCAITEHALARAIGHLPREEQEELRQLRFVCEHTGGVYLAYAEHYRHGAPDVDRDTWFHATSQREQAWYAVRHELRKRLERCGIDVSTLTPFGRI